MSALYQFSTQRTLYPNCLCISHALVEIRRWASVSAIFYLLSVNTSSGNPLNNTEPPRNDAPEPPAVSIGPEYTTSPTPEPTGIVGIALISNANGIFIESVIPSSPAEKAGLKAYDQISTIDSVNIYHVTLYHGEDLTVEGLKEIPAVRKLLLGQPGRSVYITIYRYPSFEMREDGHKYGTGEPTPLSFTVVRASKNTLNIK